ncbi:MAG: OB-fold nucleic acid binding domain-containing protein, partial [Candidatus Krumholzibacteria bacterium]|nr:OB-fold nucleic acid binding domain-containing protein [Candidatus Krumholzibacteria bacterium]
MSEQEITKEGGRERDTRMEKLSKLREIGINPYPYRFDRTHSISDARDKAETLLENGTEIALAGRVMSLRGHGHTSFGNIKDGTSSIQFYIKDADVDEKTWSLFKLIDLGDIVGIHGALFMTKTGELTIKARSLELLGKSILPLPEKYHGLQDKELRYRRRYLDLIVNDDVMKVFRTRTMIIDTVRDYLREHGFLEVETPILQPLYGGAMARPFVTHHNALDMTLYLRIADELYLKRLVVGGMERVFEFSKDFRNEGMDRSHNPEFTMLECYAAYWDYNDMMELTEDLYVYVLKKLNGSTKINFKGKEIDFKKPWKRMTMLEAVKKFAKIDAKNM